MILDCQKELLERRIWETPRLQLEVHKRAAVWLVRRFLETNAPVTLFFGHEWTGSFAQEMHKRARDIQNEIQTLLPTVCVCNLPTRMLLNSSHRMGWNLTISDAAQLHTRDKTETSLVLYRGVVAEIKSIKKPEKLKQRPWWAKARAAAL